MDLYKAGREKTVWDLKVNHLGREYDVVGLFNWSERDTRDDHLQWADLGYEKTQKFHVYDFWEQEYLGVFDYGMIVRINPSSARVLTLVPVADHPRLVSTSRHMTQGWVDLVEYEENPESKTVRGVSRIPGDEPYTLTFGVPGGSETFRLKEFTVEDSDMAVLKTSTQVGQGSATATVWVDGDGEFAWTATFEPETDTLGQAFGVLDGVSCVYNRGEHTLDIELAHGYWSQHWYLLRIDDEPLGYMSHWDAKIPCPMDMWTFPNKTFSATTINLEGEESKKVEAKVLGKP